MSDPKDLLLAELGEVKGQLKMMVQLMQSHHESTHQRIEDFRHAVEGRLTGVEARVTTLEGHERSTAMKSAGSGALSGAIMGGAVELIKFIANH
ncbi:hypothetical protein [Variovorax sp. E3]|uniref:hypothetical protein n=1 Tax=Variovorax sp. E3 TaxID=1914993 RepID=UPI0018DEB27F|nr:hypothetical protein [Variovorax sp. E3]